MPESSPMFAAAARQGRLIRKELSEILRDRRTMVTLVVMPLLIYPLLGVGFTQFLRAMAPMNEPRFAVGSDDPRSLQVFAQMTERFGPKLRPFISDASKTPTWTFVPVASVDAAVRANEIDLGIVLERVEPKKVVLRTTYVRNSAAGPNCALWVERIAALTNLETLEEILKRPDSPPVFRVDLQRNVLAGDDNDGIISLSSVIPFVLILMTITGAVYPAIDLTAGERERGTLEILVAAPVPRLNLLIAKYAAVVFVAVLTAVVNLTAMTATLYLNPLGPTLLGGGGLSVGLIAQLFAILLLFAAFFSALLLTITSFARSFKEAQAYLIPVMLFSMAPGAVGLLPDLRLSEVLAVTPLVNIVLLGRDLLDAKAEPGMAVLVIIATLVYAVAALGLASRVFGAEAVLYNERNSWGDLVRRPLLGRSAATPSTALWSLALMTPTFFVLEGVMRRSLPTTGFGPISGTIAVCLILFVGWPALFAWHERVDWRTGFGVGPSSWWAWLAAVFLGASVGVLVSPALAWLRPAPPEWLREASDQVIAAFRQGNRDLRTLLIVALVTQGLVEELYFRGYLWGALERHTGIVGTIAATSVLFGVAHVVMGGPLGLERLLPSTLLGLLLGVVRWRAGSVGPGMVLHALHNALLGILGQSDVARESDALPLPWLFAAGVGAIIGATLLFRSRKDA
jgi:sodium transport system permease protein